MNREDMKDSWLVFLFDDLKKRAENAGTYKSQSGAISVTLDGQKNETILFLRTHLGIYVFFEYIVIYALDDGTLDYDLVNEKDLSNYESPFCKMIFKEKIFDVNVPVKLTIDEEEDKLKTSIQSWDKTFSAEFFVNLLEKCSKAHNRLKELIIKGAAESFQM